MKKIYILFLLTLTSLLNANTIVTYNFSNPSGNLGTSQSYTRDDVTIDVFGYTYARAGITNGADDWRQADLFVKDGALGIDNSSSGTGYDNSNQIDNRGWYDLLVIKIPTFAAGEKIRFSALGLNDDWILGWSDELVDFNTVGDPSDLFDSLIPNVATGKIGGGYENLFAGLDDEGAKSYTFSGTGDDFSTNYFYIGGKNLDRTRANDDIRVTRFKIEVQPVPEPSTYAMFGTAFAILGFVGYRSHKNQK